MNKNTIRILLIFFTLTILLFLSYQLSFSQSNSSIHVGMRVGFNLGNASLNPDPPDDYLKSRVEPIFGAYSDFSFSENFFISVELLYLRGGFIISYRRNDLIEKLDYISIPISAKYKFLLRNTTTRPFLYLGPNLNFRIKSEESLNGVVRNSKNEVKPQDFGFHIGGGLEHSPTQNINVFVDCSYSLGLMNISKISTIKVYLRNIPIKMGVAFKVH